MSKKSVKAAFLGLSIAASVVLGGLTYANAQYGGGYFPPFNPGTPAPPGNNSGLNFGNIPNPFVLAADALGLSFAQNFLGGQQGINNWFKNWNEVLLPAEKDMTAQWNTAKIDRARNYGTGLDSLRVEEARRTQELHEYEERVGGISETACAVTAGVTGSNGGGLSLGSQLATAVTRSLGSKMTKDAMNNVDTPAEQGAVADYGARYKNYAQTFCDPLMNGGQAGCTPVGPQVKNGDISIENFLLRDTIDMSKPEQELATDAILRNLVMPNVENPIPQTSWDDFTGRNSLIKKRELQALRNMPIAVVSSIIGRRTAIPDSNVSDTIRPIRERAGVDPQEISDKASMNEIMLALSKERFYDANYFATISKSSKDQVAQEQMGVDVLTQITLRQIHLLQEQMNGLMAARASIKHNGDNFDNMAAQYGSSTPN